MSKKRRKSERVMWEAFVDFIWNDPKGFGLKGAAHYDVKVMTCCSISIFRLHQKSTKVFFMNEMDYFGTSEDLE